MQQRLSYLIATTIDGRIARPDGSFDIFVNEGDHVADYLAALQTFDSVIMGRRTYEIGAKFGVTNPYPWLKTYVASSTLTSDDPNVTVVTDAVAQVRALKAVPGRGIYLCGGGQLATLLLEHQLIDEIVLKLNPVIAGDGIPVFGSGARSTRLTLVDSKVHGETGVIVIRYRVGR